jgi:hypothetical protein
MGRDSVVSFMPVFAPGMNIDIVGRTLMEIPSMRHREDEECLVMPSYQIGENDFSGRLYWRGPLWINTNWLLHEGARRYQAPGIASALRHSVLKVVGDLGCREYYDPHGDAAHGAKDFSWTAALYLDLAAIGGELGPEDPDAPAPPPPPPDVDA